MPNLQPHLAAIRKGGAMSRKIFVACICFLLPSAFRSSAQSTSAVVVGVIRDATGGAVPAADVTIRNVDTNISRQTVSDERGEFTLTNLAPGHYELTARKTGFHLLRETGIELQVNQTARLDLTLQIGALAESVVVSADPPLLNTENQAKGDVIVTQEILEMPLNGRDVFDLAFLVPGVVEKADSDYGGPAVNGARSDGTNFLMGGFSMRDPRYGQNQASPNLDAIQEFKMETSGYSAEYGRLSGGVMSMVLKSGTNRLHGTLFEFVRNDLFDARNFFADDKPKLRRNQFGAVVDGPVWIPNAYNGRNRTFFMFSWESFRQSVGNIRLSRVPTPLERTGDFSQTRDVSGNIVLLKDPLAGGTCTAAQKGGCFPGNRIPASRISPIAAKIVPYWPLPNHPADINNYLTNVATSSPWNSFISKFDHRLSQKHTLSFQLFERRSNNAIPFDVSDLGVPGSQGHTAQTQLGLTLTSVFTPALINEFRGGFTRVHGITSLNDGGRNYAEEFGISGVNTEQALWGFPLFNVRDLAVLGDRSDRPFDSLINLYEWNDTATWVKGPHQVKFGGMALRTQSYHPYVNNNRGTFNFLGFWTTQPFGDFLLGSPDSASRSTTVPRNYILSTDYGLFVEDNWKATPRLTFNIGVRYDLSLRPTDKYGRYANFVPEVGKIVIASDQTVPNLAALVSSVGIATGIGLASDYGIPPSLVENNYKNFSPRFGFAWRPLGGNRSVVRGGYGIFYGQSMQDPITNDLANIFPFAVNQSISRGANPNIVTLANPFANAKGSSVKFDGYELHPGPQYMQSWNLTTERELSHFAALEIGYTGSKGTHLTRKFDLNQPFYDPALRLPGGSFPRPYPQVANTITYYRVGSNSNYNAGTVSLRRRLSGGFFYRLNYTYGKSIDDASNYGNGQGQAQDARNLSLERGRSNFDRGHAATMDYSWQIPWRGRSGVSKLLRGWQLAGTGRAMTGAPFTPMTSNVNLNQGGALRPNRIAKGTLPDPSPSAWFDISAFPVVPVGDYHLGSSGRDILDASGMVTLNASLIKNAQIGEFGRLQFRWEVFNMLNHTNFSQPVVNVNALNGGTITAAAAARSMQFGLRYQF